MSHDSSSHDSSIRVTAPLRVALVSDTYLPEINGVTTVLRTMRDGLRARGHHVLLLAPRYDRPGPDDTDVIRRPSMPFPFYPAVRLSLSIGRYLDRAFARFRPEVVHVATEGPLGFAARRWALARGVPLVTSFHTDFPRYAERYLGARAAGPIRRYCAWFHAPARVTQTPSEETARELRALGLERVMVWGRGVDPLHFTPSRRSESRRATDGMGGRPVVLHVGRLAREKDTDVLVAAFTRAHERLGDTVRFEVSGDGPEGATVRERLPFARHRGFLDRERLADLYADCDVFVFPSPTETCGLVALEAMASGIPVIAANAGGVLENVRPDENGLLVPAGDAGAFADAIATLIGDPVRRQRLATGARAWSERRSWAAELDVLEAMYASLARGAWAREG
jgi:glycosyltransferase involved in cell wall biosynthesis